MSTLQKIQIQGPGLKKQGIVVLQFLFIGFFVFIEMTIRTGVGILTGIAICAATFGSLRFGRPDENKESNEEKLQNNDALLL